MKTVKKRVVVQVVQHLSPGGIEMLALELQRCADPNDEVHIISLEGGLGSKALLWPLLAERKNYLHFLNKKQGLSANTLWKLYRLLRQLKPHVLHSHHIGPLIYGGLAGRLAGVPVLIHTEHDAWHLRNQHRCKVARWALNLVRPRLVADATLVSRLLRERLQGVCPVVIHNGVDVERFCQGSMSDARRQFSLPVSVKIIGCAARLATVKGHGILLDAIFRLPVDVHLALAGVGPLQTALEKQVRELGLDKRVHFLGRVDDMPQFYRAIDVFCLASLNEGMPLSPLEAQACGTPVVLTNVGACREALCEKTGLLVDAKNARALTLALKRQINKTFTTSPREFVLNGKSLSDMVQAYKLLASS